MHPSAVSGKGGRLYDSFLSRLSVWVLRRPEVGSDLAEGGGGGPWLPWRSETPTCLAGRRRIFLQYFLFALKRERSEEVSWSTAHVKGVGPAGERAERVRRLAKQTQGTTGKERGFRG